MIADEFSVSNRVSHFLDVVVSVGLGLGTLLVGVQGLHPLVSRPEEFPHVPLFGFSLVVFFDDCLFVDSAAGQNF